MEQLGFAWADFHEIRNLSSFRKFVENIQVRYKCDKVNGYFTRRHKNISDNFSLNSSSNERRFGQMLQRKLNILRLVIPPHTPTPQNRAVYEIMCKNMLKTDRPQTTIYYSKCWITKATRTHSVHVILIAFPRQQRIRECASILLDMYNACLV